MIICGIGLILSVALNIYDSSHKKILNSIIEPNTNFNSISSENLDET